MQDKIFGFEIPGHTTRREWAVYIIVAKSQLQEKHLYVGKVGDNRKGCNPIISRIGNHLSHNKIHSQFRNIVDDTTKYNYECFYAVFGVYDENKHNEGRDKINELERKLNKLVQSKLNSRTNYTLENKYKGTGYVSNLMKNKRSVLVTEDDEIVGSVI